MSAFTRGHVHRPIEKNPTPRPWSWCITPAACAARPERQMAHGSHLIRQHCRCGASRMIEANAGHVNRTRWSKGDDQ